MIRLDNSKSISISDHPLGSEVLLSLSNGSAQIIAPTSPDRKPVRWTDEDKEKLKEAINEMKASLML